MVKQYLRSKRCWMLVWTHGNGQNGVEYLPDPIPESARESWRRAGLVASTNADDAEFARHMFGIKS
jgi:hypothetical protein